LQLHGRQIRRSVSIEIRNGKSGIEPQRRTGRLLRRRTAGISKTSRTRKKTENHESPEQGSCQAKTLMNP